MHRPPERSAGTGRTLVAGAGDLVTSTARRVLNRPLGSLVFRSFQRYLAINGTERSLVLAGQALSAIIPLLIVVSTAVSSEGGLRVANALNARFHISGNAADAVRTLFAQPPDAAQTISIGSALLLVLSSLSVARTLQRTYEAAWQLPARGLRGTFGGVAALVLLLIQILLLSLIAGALRTVPAGSLLALVVRAAGSSALWLALQWLLLGARVPWRRLLPGAVACGVGQQGVTAVSTLWIPNVVEQNAIRYGAIGVSFAMLSWLVLIAVVLVAAAAVSVELGHGPLLPPHQRALGGRLMVTLVQLLGAEDASVSGPGEGHPARPGPGDRAIPSPVDTGGADDDHDEARRDGTADLFVLGLPTKEEAEAVMQVAAGLREQGLLDLADAALVWRTADGKIMVQQSYDPVAPGAAGGTLWGMLLGLLFLMPAFGVAVGAASGAVAGTLTDLGIDDAFTQEVAATLQPGTAAVFALVRRSPPDRVRQALLPYQPMIIRTSLSTGTEADLVRRLEEAQAELRRSTSAAATPAAPAAPAASPDQG